MAAVSELLAGEREDLQAAIALLSDALGDVAGFVRDNTTLLTTNVNRLADVTLVLVQQRAKLAEVLDVAPAALSNLARAYNPDFGTLDTRDNGLGSLNAEVVVCGALAQLGRVDLTADLPLPDPTAPLRDAVEQICARLLSGDANDDGSLDDLNGNGIPDYEELRQALLGGGGGGGGGAAAVCCPDSRRWVPREPATAADRRPRGRGAAARRLRIPRRLLRSACRAAPTPATTRTRSRSSSSTSSTWCRSPASGSPTCPVGRVESIELNQKTGPRVVTLTVNRDVELPANAVAAIQQSSLLGEKYVELAPPGNEEPRAASATTRGSPLDRTNRNVEVEELLGALSLVLNGGGLAQLQTINRELGDALEGREAEIKSTLDQLDTFIGGLDAQKEEINRALDRERAGRHPRRAHGDDRNALDTIGPGLDVINEQRDLLVSMLEGLARLGDVGTRIINKSAANTIEDLELLQPILTQLAAAGPNLGRLAGAAAQLPVPRQLPVGAELPPGADRRDGAVHQHDRHGRPRPDQPARAGTSSTRPAPCMNCRSRRPSREASAASRPARPARTQAAPAAPADRRPPRSTARRSWTASRGSSSRPGARCAAVRPVGLPPIAEVAP